MKHWLFVLFTGWLASMPVQAGLFGDDELLPADKAFAFSASIEGDRVIASWDVHDGYYLYKSKIRFATDDAGVRLGSPTLPPGKLKQDEFFGEIETYRGRVKAEIPLSALTTSASTFTLKAMSQGCADIGVCYPPQTQTVSLQLPAALRDTAAESEPAARSLADLGLDFGLDAEDELLPADEAFRHDVQIDDARTLSARWLIADGYYLYKHKFEFILDPADGVTLSAV